MEAQGLFINLCALYWSQEGHLSITKCKRRYKDCSTTVWDELIVEGIIKVSDDTITIHFLDEQFTERTEVSDKNRKNVLKRWKKDGKNTTVLPNNNERKGLVYNIEERREEKRESTRTHKSICKVFGKEYRLPQDRMPAEANFYNTIDSQVAELLTVLTEDQADLQIDAYIKHCQKTDRQLIGKAHKVCETILSSDWVKLLGEPPPPDKFKNAAFDKTLWTNEAWEKEYAFELKNNPAFRKHFGYEELRSSSPMGSNGKP